QAERAGAIEGIYVGCLSCLLNELFYGRANGKIGRHFGSLIVLKKDYVALNKKPCTKAQLECTRNERTGGEVDGRLPEPSLAIELGEQRQRNAQQQIEHAMTGDNW